MTSALRLHKTSVAGPAWDSDVWEPKGSLRGKSSVCSFLEMISVNPSAPTHHYAPSTHRVYYVDTYGASVQAQTFASHLGYTAGHFALKLCDVETSDYTVVFCVYEASRQLQSTEAMMGSGGEDILPNWDVLATSCAQEGVSVNAKDLCEDRIARIIEEFDSVPTSYNQILAQGALDYCRRVVSKLDERDELQRGLLRDIQKFVSQIEGLKPQRLSGAPSTFSLIDLQLIEDRFELLQEKAAELNILQVLGEIPTAELLNP